MANFSKDPKAAVAEALQKGYVGVQIEQGVPLLDRDLNLLADLVAERSRQIVEGHIGDGLAAVDDGFAVTALSETQADNDFFVSPGTMLIGGRRVTNPIGFRYREQTPAPPDLHPPTTPLRRDYVYVDTWVDEVDETVDTALANGADVQSRTSVRSKLGFHVRVSEGVEPPPPAPGYARTVVAAFLRSPNDAKIKSIYDLRRRLALATTADRLRTLGLPFLPFITGLSKFTGSPGEEIVIRGENLGFRVNALAALRAIPAMILGGPVFEQLKFEVEVRFGALRATVREPLAPDQLVVNVPDAAPAGDVTITVTTAFGDAAFTLPFKIVTDGRPGFHSPGRQLEPSFGRAGNKVKLFGVNFTNATVAFVSAFFPPGGGPFAATIVGDAPLSVQVPDGLKPGPYKLQVTKGTFSSTSDDLFTVWPTS